MPKTLFEDFFDESEPCVLDNIRAVPNVHPLVPPQSYRIALIGEAPGADEVAEGKPFVGYSGRELDKYLSHASILRNMCFVGNVCQHRPFANKLATFKWLGPEIQDGLSKLSADLVAFRPNVVVCLGAAALHAFKEGRSADVSVKKSGKDLTFNFPNPISSWRGSFFMSHLDAPLPNVKCIATYHPAACLRNFEWMPLLMLDLKKAANAALTPELVLPDRVLRIDLSPDQIVSELQRIKEEKPIIAIDIEGYVAVLDNKHFGMKCISVAINHNYCFIVPFAHRDNRSVWSVEDETRIWRALASVLSDPSIGKILQNSLYDRFVLQYSYNLPVRGVVEDTMLKHWELYSELEKSLGFQCSVYTMEPYYKEDRESESHETFWTYCCKDSAVTHEISGRLDKFLRGKALQHYRFNMDLLNPFLYMELQGIQYNWSLAKERYKEVMAHIYDLQVDLDKIAGTGLPSGKTKGELISLVQDLMCYKRDRTKPKKEYAEVYDINMRTLLGLGPLSKQEVGRLAVDCDLSLNIKSDKFKKFLYETLNLPAQIDPKTKALTSDYEALLKVKDHDKSGAVDIAISIGMLRTRAQMLSIHPDKDGRVRCGYNTVGTETGRITCYTSPTGSGYNLQTIPSENPLRPEGHPLRSGMRDLFTADPGYYLFQCDLSGADGWTVGAHLAALGESTMLADLKAKIKPAQRIAYMLRHGNDSLRGLSRDEIKIALKEIKKEDFDYFMCKCGIWGICYLMGVDRLANLILEQSEGRIKMSRTDVATFRSAVYACYKPNIWHDATKRKLSNQPYPPRLTSASGHTRIFFGRYSEVLGEALANEPQENTTYATNLAAYNLWKDPENRVGNKLRIVPLHQVHDALVGQFKIEDLEWALPKIKSYFNNTLEIAGLKIVIPFSGQYGHNWAFDKDSQVGTFE